MKGNLIWVLVFLLSPAAINAQNHYSIKHYTSENGLPQSSIKNIASDSEGFIWLATEDGLVRFDGRKFYVFNQSNLPLKSNRVTRIQPSFRNEGTPTHPFRAGDPRKVYYADFESHEVVRIQAGKVSMHKGNYVESEKEVQVIRKDPRVLNFIYDLPDPAPHEYMDARFIINCGSQNGSFYLCDSSHVSYFYNWQKKYEIDYSLPKMWNCFSMGENLYYFHDQGYFTKIDRKKATTFPLSGDILSDPAYKTRRSTIKLYWNNNSDQGFLFLNKNLYLLAEQKNGDLVTELLIAGFDLNADGIESVYFDKATGKTYLGSRTNGLFIVSRQEFQSLTVRGDNIANSLYAQLADRNRILTPNGIILGKDNLGKVVEKSLPILKKVNQGDKHVILEDKNATIWVKQYVTLFHLDKKRETITGQWKVISEISSVIQAMDGKIWLATGNQGLYSIDPEHTEKGLTRFAKDSLRNITYLDSYSAHELLVGTTEGLYKVNLITKKYRLIRQTEGLYIKSIHKFNQDQVWITAKEKGVLLLDKDEFLTTFPMDKNRYLASPHCVVSDGLGYLWVPTNKGLFQMAIPDLLLYSKLKKSAHLNRETASSIDELPSELFYMYHSTDEGFNINEFNGGCQPCGVKLENGTVSLPSLNGFVWFKPYDIAHYVPKGELILDKTELNGRLVPATGDTIQLTVDPKNIKLYFSVANFGNDYNLNLSYTLLERGETAHPADWIHLENSDFTVRYSSLQSGNYTLLIRKLNGFGINNYSIKKLYILVPQRWYETTWAFILFGLTLIASFLLSAFYYNTYRLSAIEQENKRLEGIIEKRTETLNQALETVEESKIEMSKQIHLLSRLVTSISHDIQSPLRFIGFASKKLPDMIDKNQLEKAADLGVTISDLSDRMSGMLQDTLDFIKVEVYGNKLHFEDIKLNELVQTKLEIFKMVELNGSRFVNEVPTSLTVFSDYHFLSIIIHNLIDNAAKYTYNGQIRIYSREPGDFGVELIISNTGTGLSNEMIESMNLPIHNDSLKDLVDNRRLTGLGLLIVKEMAELAGITIKVTQTDMTSFHLFFK